MDRNFCKALNNFVIYGSNVRTFSSGHLIGPATVRILVTVDLITWALVRKHSSKSDNVEHETVTIEPELEELPEEVTNLEVDVDELNKNGMEVEPVSDETIDGNSNIAIYTVLLTVLGWTVWSG